MSNSRFPEGLRYLLFMALVLKPFPALAELDLLAWSDLLGEAVEEGYVDYTRWDENPRFQTLVEQVAVSDTSTMNTGQKLVFYINAYNILAARGILDGASPASLLGRYRYFKLDKYTVAGERISLHELEHERIRPLKEPRIHFAIVCASMSCPILQSEAYSRSTLDQQLEAAARGFVNDPRRNRLDAVTRRAELSSIFRWFEEDFVEAAGTLQAYLAPLVEDPRVSELLKKEAFEISYKKYDWSLNGVR